MGRNHNSWSDDGYASFMFIMEEMERADKEEEERRREEKQQKRAYEEQRRKERNNKVADLLRWEDFTDFEDFDFSYFCWQHELREQDFTKEDLSEILKMAKEPKDDWQW